MKYLNFLVIIFIVTTCCNNEDSIVKPSGKPPQRNYGGPKWGPNNLIIFRHSPQNVDSSGLWLIKSDGSDKRPFLLAFFDGDFDGADWSNDGKWLALHHNGQIYKIKTEKDSLTQLTTGSLNKFWPCWSSDGNWIAYEMNEGDFSQRGLWRVDKDGSNRRLIFNNKKWVNNPDISPSNDKIIFVGRVDDSYFHELAVVDTSGLNLKILFHPAHFGITRFWSVSFPSYSPDGTKIVFEVNPGENLDTQIWIINSDGSSPKIITNDGGLEPSWSPDGQRIVYVKYSWLNPDTPGNGKLWIMDADGKNKRQLTF